MAQTPGIRSLWHDLRAMTATEYALIASALAFVLIASFAQLGVPLAQIFTNLGSRI
jgi:Flp pilus assembly pilin Flp